VMCRDQTQGPHTAHLKDTGTQTEDRSRGSTGRLMRRVTTAAPGTLNGGQGTATAYKSQQFSTIATAYLATLRQLPVVARTPRIQPASLQHRRVLHDRHAVPIPRRHLT
jgi:hypothetical protein